MERPHTLKNGIIGLAVALFFFSPIFMAGYGCGKPDGPVATGTPEQAQAEHDKSVSRNVTVIKTASSSAAQIGLNQWSKKDAAAAKEAATALSKNIKEVLNPYFANTAGLPSSSEVQTFLNSSLMKDLNPDLRSAIVTASATLDLFLPVPSADKIDPDAVKYIQAFLSGLSDACDSYLGTTKEVAKPTIWIK